MKSEAGLRRRFDVIVVGSGPAGVSAAWPLVQAGIDVLMVDAADPAPPPPAFAGTIGALRADPEHWRYRFGGDYGGLAPDGDISPKFATPLTRALTGSYAAATGLQTRGFWAAGSLSQGGLSNIWGAVAETYGAAELAGFPFPAAELARSYDAVKARIGVTDEPPAPRAQDGFRSPVAHILRRAGSGDPQDGVRIRPARNAVLASDQGGRQACRQCGLCLWGCAHGSIYSSAQELPALRRWPNFTYLPHARVLRLLPEDGRHGVEVAQDAARLMLSAGTVVLAAGTLATTALVLRLPGLADKAVRLLTNPVGAIAFVVPGCVGQSLPEHSFSLGQLSYTVPIPGGRSGAAPDEAAGILYGADTLPLGVIADRIPLSRPTALHLARALMPALVLATCYIPGHYSRNTLRLRPGGEGITVEGAREPDAERALLASARALARRLQRLGAYAVPGSLTLSLPGADAHYAGTLPMGGQGPAACTPDGALAGHPGIYVVDGAALPVLPARHCTLTIMANADRIARRLAETMQGALAG